MLQISALDQEIIEVDPDTKEMLKMLVSLKSRTMLFQIWMFGKYFNSILSLDRHVLLLQLELQSFRVEHLKVIHCSVEVHIFLPRILVACPSFRSLSQLWE